MVRPAFLALASREVPVELDGWEPHPDNESATFLGTRAPEIS